MYTPHIHICLLLQGSMHQKGRILGFNACQVVNPDIVQLGFRKGDAVDAERARKWMSLERQGAHDVPIYLVYLVYLVYFISSLFRG